MSQEASERKKLLLISPMLHQGGFERVCVETARLMWPYYDVSVLIFTRKDLHYDIKGIKVIDINVPARDGLLFKSLNLLKRIRRVRHIKAHHGFDYSYSFGASANRVNVLTRTGEKVITSLRGSIDLDNRGEMKRWCRRSDLLVSVSRDMMERVRQTYGYKNNTFLYNPLDIDRVCADAKEPITDFPFPADCKTVISVGRADEQKGYWHLIKAFSIAAAKQEDLRLVILGDGDFTPYATLAKKLGVADKCAFPGVRKNPFPYVAASTLFVLSSNHEGFPNALLEAMALSKPVIATDCVSGPKEILLSKEDFQTIDANPGWKKMYATYGVLLPDMSPVFDDTVTVTGEEQALAYEILSLCRDDERYRAYQIKGRERAEQFSPERYAQNLRTILDRLSERDTDAEESA